MSSPLTPNGIAQPEAAAAEPDIAEIRVADRLRQFRRDKGMTLKQLSEAALLSPAYLSRVENYQVSLTISALERLARVLGVAIAAFFAEDEGVLPITITRAGEGSWRPLRGQGDFRYQTLAAAKAGKLLEPLLVDIDSEMPDQPLLGHPGEEFNYVLEGEFIFTYGRTEYHLKQGDAAYYDGAVPHAARAVPGARCRLLVAVASRDYMYHGDHIRLLEGEGT